jgi:hypothetical protein
MSCTQIYEQLYHTFTFDSFTDYSKQFGMFTCHDALVDTYQVSLVDHDLSLIGWALDLAWEEEVKKAGY